MKQNGSRASYEKKKKLVKKRKQKNVPALLQSRKPKKSAKSENERMQKKKRVKMHKKNAQQQSVERIQNISRVEETLPFLIGGGIVVLSSRLFIRNVAFPYCLASRALPQLYFVQSYFDSY